MNESVFRPRLSGVVAKDLALSRRVMRAVREALTASTARMEEYGGIAEEEREARELLCRLSASALEEARMLEELAAALGGTRERCMRAPSPRDLLARQSAMLRRRIEEYEALMCATGDRVVRSVLTRLITAVRRDLGAVEEQRKLL